MAIRNTSKALLLSEGRILVNRCASQSGDVYYDLPGGGQRDFETMEEALVREVLEETGYHVRVVRFVALAEEISDYILQNPAMDAHREYAHRTIHIFLAEPDAERRENLTEMDFRQQESIWLPIPEADKLYFLPAQINGRISKLIREEAPQHLGCKRWNSPPWS